MKVGIDTNILWPLVGAVPDGQNTDAFEQTRNAVLTIVQRGGSLCIMLQNLVEFYAVATRPTDARGCGLKPSEAADLIQEILDQFELVPEETSSSGEFVRFCLSAKACGKQAHDARLAASYFANGVSTILTNNKRHFHRFSDMKVLSPTDNLESFNL